MAVIRPFRALRPLPSAAASVAAVPYDVVSADEARALVDGNPLSFLRVSRAEVELPPDTNPYADLVYETAARNFQRLREAAPLVVEETPSVYAYRLRMGSHAQTGIAAGFSIDEYERDIIRKHEKTRRDKEDDRTRHIVELRAQTGPVFLTYPATPAVDTAIARVTERAPLFDFAAADGVQHTVWHAAPDEQAALVGAFRSIPVLYIADGHHRAASAMRARDTLRSRGEQGATEADAFLAVAFPHDQTQILPYHRVVKDLAGRSPEAFLEAVGRRCTVQPAGELPECKGQVAMYLAGRWHRLTLGPAATAAEPADRLDVALLHEQVLAPLLGIGDIRTDKRIDFVGGIRGPRALERLVDEGAAAVAFAMHPVGVSDLMQIADSGGIMPPKSTWFEPKLRDGLLIRTI
jgi:uncharacterized protein (DUF1015 family)